MSEALVLVNIILQIGLFIIAYLEFKKWKTQYMGTKQIDVAFKLGRIALEFRQEFKRARNVTSDLDSVKKNIEQMVKLLHELYEIRWEVDLVLDQSIEGIVEECNAKFHELSNAWAVTKDGGFLIGKAEHIRWGEEDDSFGLEIKAITEKLVRISKAKMKSA